MNNSSISMTRYLRTLTVAYGVLLIGLFVETARLFVGTYDIKGFMAVVALLGGASAWVASTRPAKPPFTVETLAAGSGLIMAAAFIAGKVSFGFSGLSLSAAFSGLSLSAAAFVVVMALTFRLLEALLAQPRETLARVDDTTAALSVAGAAMVLASLFVLPWYSLDINRTLVVSFKFLDWKRLYDEAGGSVSGVRMFYFESGYWLSALAAVLLLFVIYRSRTKPLLANPPLRWLLVGTIALMGIWQLVLVLGMHSIDDPNGEVSIGAWIGVAGHVGMVYGAFRATQRSQAATAPPDVAVAPIVGAMPPPPSGPPAL